MDEQTVVQLVFQARSGNEFAAEALYYQYHRLIRHIVTKVVRHRGLTVLPHEWDDLFAVGLDGLVWAIHNYDPARGRFGTLLGCAVRAALRNELRARARASKQQVMSLESLVGAPHEPSYDDQPAPDLVWLLGHLKGLVTQGKSRRSVQRAMRRELWRSGYYESA